MKIPDKVLKIGVIVLAIVLFYAFICWCLMPMKKELEMYKAQVEMAKELVPGLKFKGSTAQYSGSELRKEIKEAKIARTQLDSANTALLKSLKEYRLLKEPCCEHTCSTTKKE